MGGPAWVAGAEAGGVNIYGGNSITTGEASISGSILIEAGGIGNPGVGGWVNTGGDVTIKSGLGNGGGHSSGDVILEPVAGAGGASDGKVVIKNYDDGLLVVSSEDVISSPYGRLAFVINNGQHGTSVQLDSSLISNTSPILVTVEYPEVEGLTLDKAPYIASRVNGVSATVKFDLNNQSGAPQTCAINYMILV